VIRALTPLAVVLALAACGGSDDDEPLTVFAAASLTEVFESLDSDARFNFAGSDELATQIREGAEADVYAAASPRYPDELRAEGLVDEPRIFATNRLVLIVPADNPAGIESLEDLDRDGVRLVVGAEGVPIGDYTRSALEDTGRSDLLERVVSNEEDVKGVIGKVRLGEADAGFVYATDAHAAGDHVRTIELPAALQADVRYPVAVVSETDQADEAGEFVGLLLGHTGREALEEAGFGLP
jgi:molybdate transport system substrate-binding protein